MPEIVINRASEILKNYENNNKDENKNKNVNQQLTFNFETKDNIREELNKIDVLKITPIEAINILYKLKNMK